MWRLIATHPLVTVCPFSLGDLMYNDSLTANALAVAPGVPTRFSTIVSNFPALKLWMDFSDNLNGATPSTVADKSGLITTDAALYGSTALATKWSTYGRLMFDNDASTPDYAQIDHGNASSLFPGTKSIIAEVGFNVPAVGAGGNQGIFQVGRPSYASERGWCLRSEGTSTFQLRFHARDNNHVTTGTVDVGGTGNYGDGSDHYLVVVWDRALNVVYGYIDGSKLTTVSVASLGAIDGPSDGASVPDLQLGVFGGASYLDGSLFQMRIWHVTGIPANMDSIAAEMYSYQHELPSLMENIT